MENPGGAVHENSAERLWVVGLEALDHELDWRVVLE